MKKRVSVGFGIAGFVLGLLSLVMFFLIFLSVIAAILGIVFSSIQLKRNPTGLARAGLTLGIIGLLFSLAFDTFIIYGLINVFSQKQITNFTSENSIVMVKYRF